jgi:hypothetical protein
MTPGCYSCADLSNEAYHASKGISNSGLKLIGGKTPAHYFAAYRDPDRVRQTTRPQMIGTALHAAALEPAAFSSEYIVSPYPDRKASGYKAWSGAQSKIILTPGEAHNVAGMHASLQGHSRVRKLLSAAGHFEYSMYAIDPETGQLCKIRFDRLLLNGWAVDLKKCQDASEDAVAKAIANYDYQQQAAFYGDVHEWATGASLEGFVFVFIEEDPPHAIGLYVIDPEDIDRGRRQYRAALNLYAQCEESGQWPGYPEAPQQIALPYWKRRALDSRHGEYF